MSPAFDKNSPDTPITPEEYSPELKQKQMPNSACVANISQSPLINADEEIKSPEKSEDYSQSPSQFKLKLLGQKMTMNLKRRVHFGSNIGVKRLSSQKMLSIR